MTNGMEHMENDKQNDGINGRGGGMEWTEGWILGQNVEWIF